MADADLAWRSKADDEGGGAPLPKRWRRRLGRFAGWLGLGSVACLVSVPLVQTNLPYRSDLANFLFNYRDDFVSLFMGVGRPRLLCALLRWQ